MKKKRENPEIAAKRERALNDLEYFIELVHPRRMLGNVHRHIITWWTRGQASKYQLLLLPRDHMKSALVAYRAAWEITKDPTLRILYISSTSNLATKQLKFIRDILTSDTYRMFWPEMVNKDEAKREKWTEREISIDHPKRKEESVRDPTIFTAGLTTNIIGLHCDIAILDDVVVESNAYAEDGREKVKSQYSLLTSVEAAGAREWVVGTRYHPLDLYADLIQMEIHDYNDVGEIIGSKPLFERNADFDIPEHVETIGDGTGEFLWPRQQRSDGKWFGFDRKILDEKRLKYINKTHFRAQYYNDPHDVGSSVFKRDQFQYYNAGYLSYKSGHWYFKGERLNVFASIDFAFTVNKRSDFTAVVVIGVDGQSNYYILEIDRFKTDKISDYFDHILKMYTKWGFRTIRAEVVSAQSTIVKDLKENYIRKLGLSLSIDEYHPQRALGAKEERIMAVLQPKYNNLQMWHYLGGNCQVLEEELLFTNPAHDDVKDALASVIDLALEPKNIYRTMKSAQPALQYHQKFGGVG